MMGRKHLKDNNTMADIAGGRARVYDLLVGVFGHIPDQHYLDRIMGDDLMQFLETCCDMNSATFKSGVDYVNAYHSLAMSRPVEEVLEEMGVDRTAIMRGTGHHDLKPPHETLYRGRENAGESLLEIKRFYRKAGLMPEDRVNESPDYLCIELDFMRLLCLREQKQWSKNEAVAETIAHEEAFLSNHLGNWVGAFCEQAQNHARTDFYRGFAMILDAFVAMDLDFIRAFDIEIERKGNN
ncbi:MAG: molecular chaperone TorD family protein [Deltaproteobacteria bacterium]|nr:molecular chaperone TorD family protein [Deltaproteobacteria bacterium]